MTKRLLGLALATILNYTAAYVLNVSRFCNLFLTCSGGAAYGKCGTATNLGLSGHRSNVRSPDRYIWVLRSILAQSFHGRELAIAPMECQINIQSVPDASDLSKIVTLIPSTKASRYRSGSRRHAIYDHEDCPMVIARWIC